MSLCKSLFIGGIFMFSEEKNQSLKVMKRRKMHIFVFETKILK